MENVLHLIVVTIIFIVVLVAAFYSSKWVAKAGGNLASRANNIKVIETFKIAPNKYIQIIQLGSKYYSIGVTKDQITFLTPLEEEQLDLSDVTTMSMADMSFTDALKKMMGKDIENKKEK